MLQIERDDLGRPATKVLIRHRRNSRLPVEGEESSDVLVHVRRIMESSMWSWISNLEAFFKGFL